MGERQPLRRQSNESDRESGVGGTSEIKTIPEDRPLSPNEMRLAEYLLRNFGIPEAIAFIPQLQHAHVTARCPCGCPTVDLSVSPEFRVPDPPRQRLIVDVTGQINGKLVGVMIFQDEGSLSLFEGYRLENVDDEAFAFPPVDTIARPRPI